MHEDAAPAAPAAQVPSSSHGTTGAESGPAQGDGRHRVFFAEDHPLVRDWFAHLIRQHPDVTLCGTAGTAEDALAAIGELQPELAVVEIGIRGNAGLNLIKDIRRLARSTAVVVLSAFDESLYAQRAVRAGALAYVNKREATRDLVPAMREALRGRPYFSEEFKRRALEQLHGTPAKCGLSQLSDRELEVFELLGQGFRTSAIAERCGISIKTVQMHCKRMKTKLNLASGAQLVREAWLWSESQRNH